MSQPLVAAAMTGRGFQSASVIGGLALVACTTVNALDAGGTDTDAIKAVEAARPLEKLTKSSTNNAGESSVAPSRADFHAK